jgi:IrrE N-terminal-like domain
MMGPLWVYELAQRFWHWAGGEPDVYPRDLRLPIARAFALSPVGLPNLSVGAIERWLSESGVHCPLGARNRPLRACLVAYGGAGTIFLDTTDPTAEQRFSLAHELAHFLHDYVEPRRQAAEKLGPEVLEVFDGLRAPRPQEQIQALLAHAQLGFHVHLMERSRDGDTTPAIDRVEHDADRLALELLAPEAAVRADMTEMGHPTGSGVEALLERRYGLPAGLAGCYKSRLVFPEHRPTSILDRLRLVK